MKPLLPVVFAALLLGAATPALAEVAALDLVQPVSDYKLYVSEHLETLVDNTKTFTDAVKAGDIDKAADAGLPSGTLEEVTVTAQKKSENLQKSAAAVTAISAETLVSEGITDLTDAQITAGYGPAPMS